MSKNIAHARVAAILDRLRRGSRPTMADKARTAACMEELDAFRAEYLARNGELPEDIFTAIEARRKELKGT